MMRIARGAGRLLIPLLILLGPPDPARAEVAATWEPDRPITIVVPWAAGGSTDQVTRLVAPLLEDALGTPVVVVNQPGASGSIGTRAALAAPRDGHTWSANAMAVVGTYAVVGLLETTIDDWHVYLHVANVSVLSVHPDAPWHDLDALLAAMGEGVDVTVSTAGVSSSGANALSILQAASDAPLSARAIAYDGGAPAVLAAASGETMATTQLASEQADLLRAGRLRALAAFSETPLKIEGLPPIPPMGDLVDAPIALDHFGLLIPRGVPPEVRETVDRVWREVIAEAPSLRAYALERGAVLDPAHGPEAVEKVRPAIAQRACARLARGEARTHPAEIGVECGEA